MDDPVNRITKGNMPSTAPDSFAGDSRESRPSGTQTGRKDDEATVPEAWYMGLYEETKHAQELANRYGDVIARISEVFGDPELKDSGRVMRARMIIASLAEGHYHGASSGES